MPQDSAKGRIVGFIALGALVVLVVVAFMSERDEGTDPSADAAVSEMTSADLQAPETSLTQSIPEVQPGTVVAEASTMVLSPQARLLAERLKCVCGCGMILATCNCLETPGSRDMKKYLQELVDEGRTPADVTDAMVARYGREVLP